MSGSSISKDSKYLFGVVCKRTSASEPFMSSFFVTTDRLLSEEFIKEIEQKTQKNTGLEVIQVIHITKLDTAQ